MPEKSGGKGNVKEEKNMSYIFEHTVLGFCWWDIPALIVLIAVIAVFVVKHRDMKKQEKDLEDQISELYTDDTVGLEEQQ